MKELKAEINGLASQGSLTTRKIQPFKKLEKPSAPTIAAASAIASNTRAIVALQPQVVREAQPLDENARWERLLEQAQRINQLAAQLEEAMFELKAIANVAPQKETVRATHQIKTECEYEATIVPFVTLNKAGALVLTSRAVDLFRSEREATLLAHSLRNLAKRKQASPHKKRDRQFIKEIR